MEEGGEMNRESSGAEAEKWKTWLSNFSTSFAILGV